MVLSRWYFCFLEETKPSLLGKDKIFFKFKEQLQNKLKYNDGRIFNVVLTWPTFKLKQQFRVISKMVKKRVKTRCKSI